MSLTMMELEKSRNYKLIDDMVTDLIADTTYGNIFSDFQSRGLSALLDAVLISRYTGYTIREDQAVEFADGILADISIISYLKERAIYIRQQLAYEDAEYNPIENYAQIEKEKITFDGGARTESGTMSKGAQQDSVNYGAISTSTNYGQRNTTTEVGARDRTSQVAPFESSEFFNERKEKDSKATDTTQQGAVSDSSSTQAHTDSSTSGARSDSSNLSRAAYQDKTERELNRSGNIGVQTAAQMMALDKNLWENNLWIRDLAADIVHLTCDITEAV